MDEEVDYEFDHAGGQLIWNLPTIRPIDTPFLSPPVRGMWDASLPDPTRSHPLGLQMFEAGGVFGASEVEPVLWGNFPPSSLEVPLDSWSSNSSPFIQDPFQAVAHGFEENWLLQDLGCFPLSSHLETLEVFSSLPNLVNPLLDHCPLFSSLSLLKPSFPSSLNLNDFLNLPPSSSATGHDPPPCSPLLPQPKRFKPSIFESEPLFGEPLALKWEKSLPDVALVSH